MNRDIELESAIRSWMSDHEDILPNRVLDDVQNQVTATPQRVPGRRAWWRSLVFGTFRYGTTATVVLALAFVGYNLSQPAVETAAPVGGTTQVAIPPMTSLDEKEPASIARKPPLAAGFVVYPVCDSATLVCRIWAVNADGTGAREFLPKQTGSQYPLAWSPDGTRLLYQTGDVDFTAMPKGKIEGGVGESNPRLALTDASGADPDEYRVLCPDENRDFYHCGADMDSVSFSPDGGRVTYTIWEYKGAGDSEVMTSSIAILDLSAGTVSTLQSTESNDPSNSCTTAASEGSAYAPSWSPDGTLIAFARAGIGPNPDGVCKDALYVVNVETGKLRELVPPGDLHGIWPTWSPDGTTLLFHGSTHLRGSGDEMNDSIDLYTIGADGSGFGALTNDGGAVWPRWTRDGDIVFVRYTKGSGGRGSTWQIDADGSEAKRIDPDIAALTAAGCDVCAYPISGDRYWLQRVGIALWQPLPEDQR